EDLRRRIIAYGATVVEAREIAHATQYRLARGTEEATLNVYHTDKILEGGKPSGLRDLLRDWRLSQVGTGSGKAVTGASRPMPNSTPRVGTDEAGKGEYLGPLVVAGVRILGAEKDLKIRELGARDSKTLGLHQVPRIGVAIARLLGPENIRVVSLAPRVYEARRAAAGGNVNRLLGELNAQIISELKDEVEVAVVDAFGEKARSYLEPLVPEGVRLEVRPRAEDDAAVAAASILARARYLEEMEELSERVGFELPRGSTHVLEAARRVVEERGEEGLAEVAKIHFATTQQVLEDVKKSDGGDS
ncbi:MAG: ribonuclease HIII, partial [Rubrobacteraceae bacterium]|nr:ribonuclease HIII [Rubrobacteraceae bacterium]